MSRATQRCLVRQGRRVCLWCCSCALYDQRAPPRGLDGLETSLESHARDLGGDSKLCQRKRDAAVVREGPYPIKAVKAERRTGQQDGGGGRVRHGQRNGRDNQAGVTGRPCTTSADRRSAGPTALGPWKRVPFGEATPGQLPMGMSMVFWTRRFESPGQNAGRLSTLPTG